MSTTPIPLPSRKSTEVDQLYLRMLVYGPPGGGKTRLCASAAQVEEMCPIVLLDIDRGTMSLRKLPWEITVVPILTWDQVKKIVDWLMLSEHGFKTVVWDSLSELFKLIQQDIMKQDLMKPGKDSRDLDSPSLDQWYRAMNRTTRVLDILKTGTFNLLCTCGSHLRVNEQTGLSFTKLALPGTLADEVPGVFDVVGYLWTEFERKTSVTRRFLQTVGSTQIVAGKDRDVIGNVLLEEPNMTKIWTEVKRL